MNFYEFFQEEIQSIHHVYVAQSLQFLSKSASDNAGVESIAWVVGKVCEINSH